MDESYLSIGNETIKKSGEQDEKMGKFRGQDKPRPHKKA